MELGLAGRVALVTGGSHGIGRATAQSLAAHGARVALLARDPQWLGAAADEIASATGSPVLPVPGDVRDAASVSRAVGQVVEAWGGVHILVNNAGSPGGTTSGTLDELDEGALLDDFDTKFLGYLRCARECARPMKAAGWGRVVLVGGLSARMAGNYTSGFRNLALGHLARSMAWELGSFGITVNVVHPGTVRTEDWLDRRARQLGVTSAEYEKAAAARTAIGRVVEASEVSDAIAFLASDRAAAISGEVLVVSGGAGEAVYM
ncbi:MAG: SDR family oxidoreductase [Micromonosporaceae bacterium]|nr:SDR family oxidoreductase [Micromonosporaceae bacterium]